MSAAGPSQGANGAPSGGSAAARAASVGVADEHPLRKGDFVCCPAGGPAHQLINTGTTPLRYLAVSTMIDTDVWHYPDSGKYGVIGGRAPGALATEATFLAHFAPLGGGVDCWDGE